MSRAKGETAVVRYFGEIRGKKLLSRQEEVALAKRIEQGDEVAKGEMAEANLRLVISIAKRYLGGRHHLEFSDLIQAGNLGLMKAIERYDWRKGYKFSTYANWWIRQAIRREIASSDYIIKIPYSADKADQRSRELMEKVKGGEINKEEVEEKLKEEVLNKELAKKAFLAKKTLSLDFLIDEDSEEGFCDFFSDEKDLVEPKVEEEMFCEVIREALEHSLLTEREKLILRTRYGIGEKAGAKTLADISQELKVSRERVRQIQIEAEGKLSLILRQPDYQERLPWRYRKMVPAESELYSSRP